MRSRRVATGMGGLILVTAILLVTQFAAGTVPILV